VPNSAQPILAPTTSISGNYTHTIPYWTNNPELELAACLDKIAVKYKKTEKDTTIQLTVKSSKQKYTVFICVGGYDE
jgi:hypothetical protein